MNIPQRPSFGEFTAARFGPKWVYAARATNRLRERYPDSVVITPKQQRELARDYRRLYGRENDTHAWLMLSALRSARAYLRANAGAARLVDEINTAIACEEVG